MLKRQRPANKLSSFHFHEVSDIISEEDSPQQNYSKSGHRKNEPKKSENPSVASPLINSPEKEFSFKELKNCGENLRSERESPSDSGAQNRSMLPNNSEN